MTMQVLLIEKHNLHPSESLHGSLTGQNFVVEVANSLALAVEKTKTLWPNLVIFCPTDDALPMANFHEQFSELNLNIPVIIVGDNIDKSSLNSHLNENITLLTSDQTTQLNNEIVKASVEQADRFIRFPNLIIDCRHRQVLHHNQHHILTPKEFKLLHLLIKNHNQVLSRKKIMQAVWETDYMGDTRTLDVHIRWVREKIEENPSRPKYLVTIRKMGYRFIMEPD